MPARQRLIIVATAAVLVACAGHGRPVGHAPLGGDVPLHTLVLMLDGVPFSVVDSLHRAGHFSGFARPSRLISPFPSLTQVAFGSIWGEPPSPGYEDRYFDPRRNRIDGGLLAHLVKADEHAGFLRHVEVSTDPITAAVAYLTPLPAARRELAGLRASIQRRAAHDSTVVAYLVATDAIAHRAGADDLVQHLLEIEDLVVDLRHRYGRRLRVVLFSDHGNDDIPTRRAPLEHALRHAGFRVAGRIEGPDDVVIPRFGLVGAAFLYGTPGAAPRLAAAVIHAEGVDLVVFYDRHGVIHVWNRAGRATLQADPDRGLYRYLPTVGDPLGLAPALARMRADGMTDSLGWAPDSVWLAASHETPYVDAVRRIVRGRHAVLNPASVVVSFEPGYHYGNFAADRLVRVTGTHGSLRTTSSLAFYMDTQNVAPELIRSDDLMHYIQLRGR